MGWQWRRLERGRGDGCDGQFGVRGIEGLRVPSPFSIVGVFTCMASYEAAKVILEDAVAEEGPRD